MCKISLTLTIVCLVSTHARAAQPPDLAKIERQIAKQPSYTAAEPLYGLFVFGPEARTRVWAVLDKSKADNDQYDVLYFDRDADGDLTEEGEHIVGDIEQREHAARFTIGDFSDPNSQDTHTSLSLTRRPSSDGSVMLRLNWQGREPIAGGFAEEAGPYTQFAKSAAEAPILWFDASGQFSFYRWIWAKDLTIGDATDLRVFLGHEGLGKNTFCAVSQDFLPKKVAVLATLIYTDNEGRQREESNHFLERC